MTAPTPPVSDVLRGIEALAAQSRDMLAEALDLISKAAKAEAMAMDTAIAALGEPHGRTVVELARMSVASETSATLNAIRDSIAGMLSEVKTASSAPPAAAASVRDRAEHQSPPDASGRIRLFGIMVPAGRMAEAEEVIAVARTSVAQNRKANPYDHYRGKNSWCKSLFLAAFAQTAEQTPSASQAATPQSGERPALPPPSVAPLTAPRQSVAAAGPVRGGGASYPEPSPAPPPEAQTPPPRTQPPGQRLHAHGTTAQTIPEEVLQQSKIPPVSPSRGRPSFFRNR